LDVAFEDGNAAVGVCVKDKFHEQRTCLYRLAVHLLFAYSGREMIGQMINARLLFSLQTQRPEQSVMQALESLNDGQVTTFSHLLQPCEAADEFWCLFWSARRGCPWGVAKEQLGSGGHCCLGSQSQ
jgi:hypothetical protein